MSGTRRIASVVCPSAPFLVSRRACAELRSGELCSASVAFKHHAANPQHRRSRAEAQSAFTRKVKAGQRSFQPRFEPLPAADEATQELFRIFRQHCVNNELDQVMALYPRVMGTGVVLHYHDTSKIARLIHTHFIGLPSVARPHALPGILQFTDRFVHDIRKGRLEPHVDAHVRLLQFLREAGQYERAAAFWAWLQPKNDTFVSAAVYGAAIEMLSAEGKTGLPELESMYAEALQRFPGTFAEYHLSPEGIVPDRGQLLLMKGTPMGLLGSICSARLRLGDWRNAYLGLDAALRLLPTLVPERIYTSFILERPAPEAFQVFMMACRSGTIPRPFRLLHVLKAAAQYQLELPYERRIDVLNSMLNAIHTYAGVGGSIEGSHLSQLVKGFENLLPGATDSTGQAINQFVCETARETIISFGKVGVRPSTGTLSSLIVLAGKANVPTHVGRAIQDVSEAGLEADEVVQRSIMLAAGWIKHTGLLETAWKNLVETAETGGRQLERGDWIALVRAAKNAGHAGFVDQQVSSLGHAITDDISHLIEVELGKESLVPSPRPGNMEERRASIKATLSEVNAKTEHIVSLIRSDKLHDFYANPIPTTLLPRGPLGPEDAMRAVYDELTTDPHLPSTTDSPQPPAQSATGFPLDVLRYENWKSVNELLRAAEANERSKEKKKTRQAARKAREEGRTGTAEMVGQPDPTERALPKSSSQGGDGDGEGAEVTAAAGADGGRSSGAAEADHPGAKGRGDEKHDGASKPIEAAAVRQEILRLRAFRRDQPSFARDP